MSDIELLEAVRAGDLDAFHRIYVSYQPVARRVAGRLARTPEDADDAVAEAFASVFTAVRKGEGPRSNPRGYILTSVRNAVIQQLRRRESPTPDSGLEDAVGEDLGGRIEERAVAAVDQLIVRNAYESLSDRERVLLWVVDVEGGSYADVGERLGLSEGGVANALFRARRALRDAYVTAQLAEPGVGHPELRKIVRFTQGTLGLRRQRHVAEHLETCGPCRLIAAEARELGSTMRGSNPHLLLPAAAAALVSAGEISGVGLGVVGGGALAWFSAPMVSAALLGAGVLISAAAVVGIVSGSDGGDSGAGGVVAQSSAEASSGASQRDPSGVSAQWAPGAESAFSSAIAGASAASPATVRLEFTVTGLSSGAPTAVYVSLDAGAGALPVPEGGACSLAGSSYLCGPVTVPPPGESINGAVSLRVDGSRRILPLVDVAATPAG